MKNFSLTLILQSDVKPKTEDKNRQWKFEILDWNTEYFIYLFVKMVFAVDQVPKNLKNGTLFSSNFSIIPLFLLYS